MDSSSVMRAGKALAAISALALAGTAHAGPFDGVYLGGQLGYASYDVDISIPGGSLEGLSASGSRGGFFIGTGLVRNDWYLGFQADVATSDADATFRSGIDSVKLEAENEYGIDARLGRQLSDGIVLYGIAGWQQTNFELTANGLSDDDDFNGFRFGVGVDIVAGERLFTRLEYTHVMYDEETYGMTDVEPQAQTFNVGLGYRF